MTRAPGQQANATTKVIALAERAQGVIEITELEPNSDLLFVGKQINPDGSITPYPRVKWWRQSVARVPATIPHLFAYLREARKRNICLIRDTPANLERQPTLRQIAGIGGRGDHGFYDIPTRLIPFDADGVKINWRDDDPEEAIRGILARLGEPYRSTSCVWALSATHGLETKDYECPTTGKKYKRWTGNIDYSRVRARITFIAERALNADEAKALTITAQALVPELDRSIVDRVHVNYIQRPHWVGHPGRDVLGNIQTIGWIKGTHDTLAVPDDLTHTARWAKAQGHSSVTANHPDAEAAVRGIGRDGEVRPHVMSAVRHLLIANPPPDVTSFDDHSINIIAKLRNMIEQHRNEISGNLIRHGKSACVVDELLQHTKPSWARWCLDRQDILRTKTIKLTKHEWVKTDETAASEAIFARVRSTIERACCKALANPETPTTELLVAPTGSRKSTLMRAAAVRYVTEQPKKTVVILMPRHKLGDEQIELLHKEHPGGNYSAAVWRGRHAWNLNVGNGHEQKMCVRAGEAEEVEKAVLDVERTLCKRGRGKKAIKCPFYDTCAYQQQKRVTANIWFAAHECAVHEKQNVFGDIGWVIFDESPLDAFMFGVDIGDQVTLELDTLRTPLPIDPARFGTSYGVPCYDDLMRVREKLYHALDKLRVPIDLHQGVAVPRENLKPFVETVTGYFIKSKNPIVGEISGEFTEEHPNLDALRDELSKTDPKPYIDAAISSYFIDNSDCDPKLLVNLLTKMFDAKYFNDPNTLIDAIYGNIIKGPDISAKDVRNLTWRGKAKPDIRPDMSDEQLKTKLQEAAVNDTVKKEVTLWKLVEAITGDSKLYGRIKVHRSKQGRIIRMVGVKPLAKGWDVQTLICDATGDAELLKAVWPQLVEAEPHGWEQLPRPKNVRVFQCVNRTISKWAVAVEGKNEKEIARKTEGARRLYAAVLMKAIEYGGRDVGVVVYKSTKDWIQKNCFVPDWLKLVHWGDVTGTNALQRVRALFVIGRPLASPEDVTRQAEALFGEYIPKREYVLRRNQGRIPTIPDAAGNNCILVDVWEHPDPAAELLRRQVTEAAIIQAAGRARAGLRGEGEPLDLHLWTDVPVPELGPVEPVLWSELEAGLDGLMLAMEGVWLRNIADAVRAFPGLFSADGLKTARAGGRLGKAPGGRVGVLHIGTPIYRTPTPPIFRVIHRRAIPGCKPTEAVFLKGVADPRGWLEARLGPLAYFEIEEVAA